MQCKDVESIVEQEGLASLPEPAEAHVAVCSQCQALVADLTSIVSMAKELPAEATPPARLWISLRTQLELEGIIKEPVAAPMAERSSSWWRGVNDLFRSRALAAATVGLLIAAAAVLQIRTDSGNNASDRLSRRLAVAALEPFAASRMTLNDQEPVAKGMILASTSPVDASLRENLQKVDDFIADCEQRISEQPQDELAREYLSNAYEQKAELLAAMMDRGGSVN